MTMADQLPRSDQGPGAAPAMVPHRSASRVWLTFECEQGNRWRVYDMERIDRRPTLVPLASRRATHRQFVIVGKHPQARRYAFTERDPDEHDLDPVRLGMQLYLGVRVKPRRRLA